MSTLLGSVSKHFSTFVLKLVCKTIFSSLSKLCFGFLLGLVCKKIIQFPFFTLFHYVNHFYLKLMFWDFTM